uniref:GSVIVT00006341001 n=1 Tax=Arundo donax TaxID=35708 RepID=A0A0A8Z5D9_ARUDO
MRRCSGWCTPAAGRYWTRSRASLG